MDVIRQNIHYAKKHATPKEHVPLQFLNPKSRRRNIEWRFGASLYGVSAIIEYVCPKEFLQFSERCLGKLGTSIGTWTF
jgi:hypothetical protein